MKTLLRIVLILGCLFLAAVMFLSFLYRDRRPPIFHAAERGDTNAIAQYLARGSNVNGQIPTYIFGSKPTAPLLAVAAERGQLETVEFLLKKGANPNERDWRGKSSLFHAMGNDEKQVEIFKRLLAAGADPNLVSSYGYTPLIEASSLGCTKEVEFLLVAGADAKGTNAAGQTSLHLAHDGSVVNLLIAAGADRNVLDQSRMTPADSLAWLGRLDALETLTNSPATKQ